MPATTIQYEIDQLRIRSDALPALRKALTVDVRRVRTSQGQPVIGRSQRSFYKSAGESLLVPTPLLMRVCDVLGREGTMPVRVGRPPWLHLRHADRDWASREGIGVEQRLLASSLMNAPFGQLVYRSGSSKRQMLGTFIRLFRSASILVVSKSRDELNGLASDLTRRSGVRVFCDPRAWFSYTPRVLATTTFHFESMIDDWQIVVFTDPSALLSQRALEKARWLARFGIACYCLRPEHQRLTAEEELELESVCGPRIYTGPTARGRLASVIVQFVEGIARPIDNAPAVDAGPVAIKRAHYWHHDARNRLIADTAIAVTQNDQQLRERLGLHLPATELTAAILVESSEHAEALRRLLPDWSVIAANSSISPPQLATKHLNGAIITEAAATEHELTSDVLIVATAQPPAWSRLQFPRVIGSDQDHDQQYIVDYADDWCLKGVQSDH